MTSEDALRRIIREELVDVLKGLANTIDSEGYAWDDQYAKRSVVQALETAVVELQEKLDAGAADIQAALEEHAERRTAQWNPFLDSDPQQTDLHIGKSGQELFDDEPWADRRGPSNA